MDKPGTHRLYKSERLCSRKAIEDLFQGGHKSMSAYPIRAVFMPSGTADTRVLVSVPKRLLKHAVDRNHVKRQVREAYRLHKDLLDLPPSMGLHIAFLWTSNEMFPTEAVTAKVCNLMQRIHESIL